MQFFNEGKDKDREGNLFTHIFFAGWKSFSRLLEIEPIWFLLFALRNYQDGMEIFIFYLPPSLGISKFPFLIGQIRTILLRWW
ncbi:unnamed protein product [Cuscuta campestris]|uniref:Uncharacterized protein n=1 Tax=Cuscuta campestris TaxID=132261 RepID=A0A484MQL0_9ASTE|nr:unnamed protein product [Cuscuta campestris]